MITVHYTSPNLTKYLYHSITHLIIGKGGEKVALLRSILSTLRVQGFYVNIVQKDTHLELVGQSASVSNKSLP